MKGKVNVSLDTETIEKLKELAKDSHTTVSQWITDRVWEKSKEKQDSEKGK